jgi:Zinc carboxypeptidase
VKSLPDRLPALAELERLATTLATNPAASVDILATTGDLPIHSFRFGTAARDTPALLVTGGVHGLERIGTDVAIAYLATLVARLAWDELLHAALERCRVIVVPLLNPVGMTRNTRANGNGVDLMRNAPAAALGGTPLLGGHRISRFLPWFMGREGSPMETEAAALVRLVEDELFESPFAIALDLHSGFGMIDRIWYPYARTREPLPDLPAIIALDALLDASLPNHVYRVEQTAQVYTIRGDLWDYVYDRRRNTGGGVLLPLTLEMGSWAWVRKNPWQGLSSIGRFNPIKPHRLSRTLRRHLPLLDFLHHAAASHRSWTP